jgi:hypothetical protein
MLPSFALLRGPICSPARRNQLLEVANLLCGFGGDASGENSRKQKRAARLTSGALSACGIIAEARTK